MHIRLQLAYYAFSCFWVPLGLVAQNEHKYLDQALPDSWMEGGNDFQQTLPVEDYWWRNFKDPLLDSLIEVAVKQNYSVQMAVDRIAMAKASLRSAQGGYSPSFDLNAGWNRQQSSGNVSQLPQSVTQYTSATVDMNREVDVFGRIRNQVKAQKESFAASKEEYYATMVSLCAQVASAYINMRELQQEMLVVQKITDRPISGDHATYRTGIGFLSWSRRENGSADGRSSRGGNRTRDHHKKTIFQHRDDANPGVKGPGLQRIISQQLCLLEYYRPTDPSPRRRLGTGHGCGQL